MKNASRLISALVILAVFSSIAIAQEKKTIENGTNRIEPAPGWGTKEIGNANWTPNPYILSPFHLRLKFEPPMTSPGQVQMQVLFSPNVECNSATIRIIEIEKLEFSSETTWMASASIKDTLLFTVNVIIPDNDTSGFRIEVEGCDFKQHDYYYFIASNGTVKVRAVNLSRAARVKQPREPHQRPLNSNLRSQAMKQEQDGGRRRSYRSFTDENGESVLVPSDSIDSWTLQSKNTSLERRVDSLNEVIQQTRKRAQAANTQLQDLRKTLPNQQDYIMKRFLQSKAAGMEWRPFESYTTEQIMEMRNEEIERLRNNDTLFREILIDLREPKHYEYVRSNVDAELNPTEQQGIYSATVSFKDIYDLRAQGIKLMAPRLKPGAPSACGGMSNSFRGRPPEACPHLPLNG
ncbi:MAG: hypothetical protein IIC66_03150 [candidate division Zixibacteria bacterium]|nr:hypothetical protein [candidate division Zixibacteria bacterium]